MKKCLKILTCLSRTFWIVSKTCFHWPISERIFGDGRLSWPCQPCQSSNPAASTARKLQVACYVQLATSTSLQRIAKVRNTRVIWWTLTKLVRNFQLLPALSSWLKFVFHDAHGSTESTGQWWQGCQFLVLNCFTEKRKSFSVSCDVLQRWPHWSLRARWLGSETNGPKSFVCGSWSFSRITPLDNSRVPRKLQQLQLQPQLQ